MLTTSWYPNYNQNKIIDDLINNWNESTNNWELSSKGIYYYSDVAGINKLPNDDFITLYPNPVTNSLHINFEANSTQAIINLFNIQGKKIFVQEISRNQQLNLKQLKSGLYLYIITANGKEKRGKLIKK